MSVHTDDTCGSPVDNGNGKHQLPPCSCCMALAQVRFPQSMTQSAFHEEGTDGSQPKRNRPKRAKSIFNLLGSKKPHSPQNRAASETADAEEWNEELHGPKPKKLWHGLDGIAVCVFGMALPLLSLALMGLSVPKRLTLVLLNHPIETLAEIAMVAAVPIINYFVWLAISKNRIKFPRGYSFALGTAIGATSFVAAICIAAMFLASGPLSEEIGTAFSTGFTFISLLSILAAASSGFILSRIRSTRDFASTKRQVLLMAGAGFVSSILAFAASEARPWTVRYIEHMAASPNRHEAKSGLALLRRLNPERELRMECSDPRAAGLAGLFIPVKRSSEHELYFALTGKPYSYRDFNNTDLSSMPDDFLSRNVVGDPVEGLELNRSTLTGSIHPRTLTASMQWTFVLKNATTQAQEARAQLALPPGAVLTGLRKWQNGEPDDGVFMASGKAQNSTSSSWVNAGHDSSGIITDLGHGRLLLHCYPIAPEAQQKILISMAVPLKPESPDLAAVPLPQFVGANFKLEGGDHHLRLQSPSKITFANKNFTQEGGANGTYFLSGTLTSEELEKPKLELKVAHDPSTQIGVFDKLAVDFAAEEERRNEARLHRVQHDTYDGQIFLVFDTTMSSTSQVKEIKRALARQHNETVVTTIPPHYVTQSVERISAAAPSRLVIVVDGSNVTSQYLSEIKRGLQSLPAGIPKTVMIASQENPALSKPVPFEKGLELLKPENFIGGQNNLQSVVQAAELAGELKNGAVLWIHGPQPASNQDIFIMSPYAAMPKFYEMTLGGGDVDTVEFFKNHPEIGPFYGIQHGEATISKDMQSFFQRWTPNCSSYGIKLAQTTKKVRNAIKLTSEEERELLVLDANRRCRELLAHKRYEDASNIAVKYGFVSPVSCAIIEQRYDAPALQGATNGTIGPQGTDATVIAGVNTAGTVRINNLANLEALFNIIANMGEVLFGLGGIILLIHGFCRGDITTEMMGQEVEITGGQRIAFGLMMLIGGLALPGTINWFIASARDANLFS